MPTRSDWIQAGLVAVADNGPDGLRIDRLCRHLGVSKGSFHHHFAGAGDFKQTLLAAYEALVVEALNQAIEQTAADNPKAALAGLTAAITSRDSFYRPDLEVAMRAWAFSDPEVRAVQERVDTRRLESLQGHLVQNSRRSRGSAHSRTTSLPRRYWRQPGPATHAAGAVAARLRAPAGTCAGRKSGTRSLSVLT